MNRFSYFKQCFKRVMKMQGMIGFPDVMNEFPISDSLGAIMMLVRAVFDLRSVTLYVLVIFRTLRRILVTIFLFRNELQKT